MELSVEDDEPVEDTAQDDSDGTARSILRWMACLAEDDRGRGNVPKSKTWRL